MNGSVHDFSYGDGRASKFMSPFLSRIVQYALGKLKIIWNFVVNYGNSNFKTLLIGYLNDKEQSVKVGSMTSKKNTKLKE
jgi:hypothetical protein